jgi:hypothetical protein
MISDQGLVAKGLAGILLELAIQEEEESTLHAQQRSRRLRAVVTFSDPHWGRRPLLGLPGVALTKDVRATPGYFIEPALGFSFSEHSCAAKNGSVVLNPLRGSTLANSCYLRRNVQVKKAN